MLKCTASITESNQTTRKQYYVPQIAVRTLDKSKVVFFNGLSKLEWKKKKKKHQRSEAKSRRKKERQFRSYISGSKTTSINIPNPDLTRPSLPNECKTLASFQR